MWAFLGTVLFCVVAAGGMWLAMRARSVPWRKAQAGYVWVAPAGIVESRVDHALNLAMHALSTRAGIPLAALTGLLPHLQLFVVDGTSWTNIAGRLVAGECEQVGPDRYLVKVGRDFASLAHELIHVVELHGAGVTDETHVNWPDRYQQAVDTYQLALRG